MGNRYRRRDLVDAAEYRDRNSDSGPTTQSAIDQFQSGGTEGEGDGDSDSGDANDRQQSVVGAAATAINSRITEPVRNAMQSAIDAAPTDGFQTDGDEDGDGDGDTTVLTASRERVLETAGNAVERAKSRGFGEAGRESVREAISDVISQSGGEGSDDDAAQTIQDDVDRLTAADRNEARYGQRPSVIGDGGQEGDDQSEIDAATRYEARYGAHSDGGSGGGTDAGSVSGGAGGGAGAGGAGGDTGRVVSHEPSGGSVQATTSSDIDTGSTYSGLTDDTATSINQTPFEGETVEDAQDAKDVFRSTAGRMSSQAKDPDVARDMFDHLGQGYRDNDASPSISTAAGYGSDQPSMNVPEGTDWQAASHEYAHLLADTYGYNDGQRASAASATYAEAREENSDADPFVRVDPDHSEGRLSQHNGEFVDDVPEDVEQLMDAANTGWARTQKAERDPNRDAEDYTVRTNYSATCAHEFLAQTSEYMQQDTAPEDDSFLRNQPDVAWSYSQVFEPSDTMKSHMSEMHHDDSVDDPFPEDPYPNTSS